jgi:glucan 1,3-beta-glucosidase
MATFSIFTLFVALRLFLLVSSAPATGTVAAPRAAAGSTYWLASITRQGTVAYGGSSDYKVFRNVKDFGAKGDGMFCPLSHSVQELTRSSRNHRRHCCHKLCYY